jgi:hypothetical protein
MTFIFVILGLISISAVAQGGAISVSINSYLQSQINYYILLLITVLTAASGAAYFFESGENIEKQTYN